MWLMLNDAFVSIVSKLPAKDGELLVRARRPGDIEKVFGRSTKVTRSTDSDYLYRAVLTQDHVSRAIQNEIKRIDYGNFKDSVDDLDLHDAYLKVWTAMASLQNPKPYSGWQHSGGYYGSIKPVKPPPIGVVEANKILQEQMRAGEQVTAKIGDQIIAYGVPDKTVAEVRKAMPKDNTTQWETKGGKPTRKHGKTTKHNRKEKK